MLVKPSVVFQMLLVPEDCSPASAAELKRSYMYLAQSLVKELPEAERGDGNVMRLSIRIMRPYWDASDEKAQELWSRSVMPWLTNITRNVSTAMHNYNTVEHPVGAGAIRYEWADYEFGRDALVRVKVSSENRICTDMAAVSDKVRSLLGEGAFGEGVSLIRVPSRESLEAQEQAARDEAARLAAEQAQAEDAQPDEHDDADADAQDAGTQDAGAQAEAEDAEPSPETAPVQPAFDIDASIWGIEYADGRVVQFDSTAV